MPTIDPFVRDPSLTSTLINQNFSDHRPPLFTLPHKINIAHSHPARLVCTYTDKRERKKKSLMVQTVNIKASQTENGPLVRKSRTKEITVEENKTEAAFNNSNIV